MSNHHSFTNSSALKHCNYDDNEGVMEICFSSGGVFKYKVNRSVYEALRDCESPGKHFHQHIRSQHKPL